jgi:predicted transcriptional regulator
MFDQLIPLLSLSNNEVKILKVLEVNNPLTVALLSKNTKIPRMTIYLTLNSLKNRGILNYNRLGKRKYWKINEKEKISKILWDALQKFNSSENITTVKTNDSGFSVIKNMESLWSIWQEAVAGNKDSRIYGIQPTESLKEILNKSDWQNKIAPINEAITNNKLIIEGLTREDYIPTYLKYFENDKSKQRKILEDLQNRMSDMVNVSNDHFKYPVDFMMFKDKAFLINWKNEVAIEIKNTDMLNFLKELFDLARGYGKKVDQGNYIRELLKNL